MRWPFRREICGGVGSDRLAGEKPGRCLFCNCWKFLSGKPFTRSPLVIFISDILNR